MSENIKINAVKEILKGSVCATILSFFFVLIFALLARFFSFSADFVPVANTIIKILSVFCAVVFFCEIREKGFLKGLLIAVAFLMISNLFFVVLGGNFEFKNLLFDICVCSFAGIVAGMIAVVRKK